MRKKIEAHHIRSALSYFALFQYPPTEEELFLFTPAKIDKKRFYKVLGQLSLSKRVIYYPEKAVRYTQKGEEIFFEQYIERAAYAKKKTHILERYLSLLRFVPSIAFVGISGSLSMNNTKQDDDIDLFIITEHKQLWTGRILAVLVAELLGLRRRRNEMNPGNKICLNLFFDARDLKIPQVKQTEYIAHEILQLKPMLNRDETYECFLTANQWVVSLFPNAEKRIYSTSKTMARQQESISITTSDNNAKGRSVHNKTMWPAISWFEELAKRLQLLSIKRNTTNERITPTQLWFFPRDYEDEIRKHR